MGCTNSTNAVDSGKENKKPTNAPAAASSSSPSTATSAATAEITEDTTKYNEEPPDMSVLREMYEDKEAFDRMSQGLTSLSTVTAVVDATPLSTTNAASAPTSHNPVPSNPVPSDPATSGGNGKPGNFKLLSVDANGDVTILPSIGFVVKTKDLNSNEKIFVNVLMFPYLKSKEMVAIPCQESTDKKGEKSKSYGVVVSATELEMCRESPEITHQLSAAVVRFINSSYVDSLVQLDALNVKVPKIKRGYVGQDEIAEIQVPAYKIMENYCEMRDNSAANNKPPATTTASVSVPLVPSFSNGLNGTSTSTEVVNDNTSVGTSKVPDDVNITTTPAAATTTTSPTLPATASTTATVSDTTSINTNSTNNTKTAVSVQPDDGNVNGNGNGTGIVGHGEVAEDSDDEEGVEANANLSALIAPKMMKGFINKQGHAVLNWKRRFFVLNNGYCTYYTDETLSPPYGKNMKGHFCLAGYRRSIMDLSKEKELKFEIRKNSALGFDGVAAAGDKMKRRTSTSVEGGDVEYMLFDANSAEEKEAWTDAFLAHALYIEAVIRHEMAESAQTQVQEAKADTQVTQGVTTTSAASANSGPGGGSVNNTSTNIRASPSTVSRSRSIGGGPNDSRQWKVFLKPEESIILSGPLIKPNPVGKKHVRQLILTNKPRIVYLDPAKLEAKGEIYWKREEDITVKLIDPNTFEVAVRSMNRTFKFLSTPDDDGENPTCEEWVSAINANAGLNSP